MKNTLITLTTIVFALVTFSSCTQTKAIESKPWDITTTDTITTETGLKYLVVEKGTSSVKAEKGVMVDVHYTGFLENGKVFDSSHERLNPISFQLGTGSVIRGWDEGIELMHIGDKLRLIIPSDLGYGAHGAGTDIPPHATLIFDVELMNVR
ncbi:MAG: FKBP-type peptidyl-prolyl cis-trans isomerase [Bacteroidia bacterium]|nr:FKBP-type peptidyl-prolyl cis-trans isomerase [Bacteroidia bacterium]